jgi:hypothetical protein
MNQEFLSFKGWLLQQEQKQRELELKISGLRDSIRCHLAPIIATDDIEGELIAQQAIELRTVQIDLQALKAEIRAKKKAYGVE